MIHLKFSSKATRFIIIAVEHEIATLKAQMQDPNMSEDELSDCSNDLAYYEIILEEIKKQSKS